MEQPYLPGFEKWVPGPLKVIEILEKEGYLWLKNYEERECEKIISVPCRIGFPNGKALCIDDLIFLNPLQLEEKGFSKRDLSLALDFHRAVKSEEALEVEYGFDAPSFMNDGDEAECLEEYSRGPFDL